MNYTSRHVLPFGRSGSSGNRPLNPLTGVDFSYPIGFSVKDYLPRDLRSGRQILIFKPGPRDADMYCLRVLDLFQLWYRETFPPLVIDYQFDVLWQFSKRTTKHTCLAVHTQVNHPVEDRHHRSGTLYLYRVSLTKKGSLWERRIEAKLIQGDEGESQ